MSIFQKIASVFADKSRKLKQNTSKTIVWMMHYRDTTNCFNLLLPNCATNQKIKSMLLFALCIVILHFVSQI